MKRALIIILVIALVLLGARFIGEVRTNGWDGAVNGVKNTMSEAVSKISTWFDGLRGNSTEAPSATPTLTVVPSATPALIVVPSATPAPTVAPSATEDATQWPTEEPELVIEEDDIIIKNDGSEVMCRFLFNRMARMNEYGAYNTPHDGVKLYDVRFMDDCEEEDTLNHNHRDEHVDFMVNGDKVSLFCCTDEEAEEMENHDNGEWDLKYEERIPDEDTRVEVCKECGGITNGAKLIGTSIREELTAEEWEALEKCAVYWYDEETDEKVYGLFVCGGNHTKPSQPTKKPQAGDTTPEPTVEPTEEPTATPEPTVEPTEEPTATPEPTVEPTEEPTETPESTEEPTEEPTVTPEPTEEPTTIPTPTPTPTPGTSHNPQEKPDEEDDMIDLDEPELEPEEPEGDKPSHNPQEIPQDESEEQSETEGDTGHNNQDLPSGDLPQEQPEVEDDTTHTEQEIPSEDVVEQPEVESEEIITEGDEMVDMEEPELEEENIPEEQHEHESETESVEEIVTEEATEETETVEEPAIENATEDVINLDEPELEPEVMPEELPVVEEESAHNDQELPTEEEVQEIPQEQPAVEDAAEEAEQVEEQSEVITEEMIDLDEPVLEAE